MSSVIETPLARNMKEFNSLADLYMDYYQRWANLFLTGLSAMARPQSPRHDGASQEASRLGDAIKAGNGSPGNGHAIQVAERENEIVVTADLPGFEDNEVQASIRRGQLTIKGEKHAAKANDKFDLSFRRRLPLPLPANAKPSESQASYHDGHLEVHIPKPAESPPEEVSGQGKAAAEESRPHRAPRRRAKSQRGRSRRRTATAKG